MRRPEPFTLTLGRPDLSRCEYGLLPRPPAPHQGSVLKPCRAARSPRRHALLPSRRFDREKPRRGTPHGPGLKRTAGTEDFHISTFTSLPRGDLNTSRLSALAEAPVQIQSFPGCRTRVPLFYVRCPECGPRGLQHGLVAQHGMGRPQRRLGRRKGAGIGVARRPPSPETRSLSPQEKLCTYLKVTGDGKYFLRRKPDLCLGKTRFLPFTEKGNYAKY